MYPAAGDSLIPRTVTTRESGKHNFGFLASATQVGTKAPVSRMAVRGAMAVTPRFSKRGTDEHSYSVISNPFAKAEGELVSQSPETEMSSVSRDVRHRL